MSPSAHRFLPRAVPPPRSGSVSGRFRYFLCHQKNAAGSMARLHGLEMERCRPDGMHPYLKTRIFQQNKCHIKSLGACLFYMKKQTCGTVGRSRQVGLKLFHPMLWAISTCRWTGRDADRGRPGLGTPTDLESLPVPYGVVENIGFAGTWMWSTFVQSENRVTSPRGPITPTVIGFGSLS